MGRLPSVSASRRSAPKAGSEATEARAAGEAAGQPPRTGAGAGGRHVVDEILQRLPGVHQVALREGLLHVGLLRPAAGAAPALAGARRQHRHEGQDAEGHHHRHRQHHGSRAGSAGRL